jgi:glycosyltransferase involved in cell wall biosynthesis
MIEGKRICVVVHYEGMSGALRSLRHRLGAVAREASIEFLVPGPGSAERDLAALGAVWELSFSALTFPGTAADSPRHVIDLARQVGRFRDHFRRSKPDLVITTSMMVPTAVLAARREGIPALVHASELLNPERLPSPAKRATARGLVKSTARWATAVVACSDMVAAQFSGTGVGVEVLYPPIAVPDEPGDRDGFRRRYGIAPDQACVAMAGSVTRGRGQDLLLRAMPTIRERVPGAGCLVVGDPFDRARDLDYRHRLDNLVRELEIEDAVNFTGAVDRIADVYAAADVVVNPARIPESFGRVACEALAAGRPVVSTRTGAVAEVLDHGRTALLVERDAPVELAGATARMLEDRELAARTTTAGRAEVQRRFDPEQIAARFRQIVEETLAGAQVRQPGAQPPAPSARPADHAEAPALRTP